jgi:phospholipid/cholesterol/gamma-HCH transport system substrate-binding protein
MEKFSLEVKVGIVVTIAVALVLAFIFILGDWNPFTNTYRITVQLNYAGGIKPGSDVMVAGAKVGKVDAIRYLHAAAPGEDAPVLGLELLIDKRAKDLIREDSTFSVYMESLLGGKIVEITPGSPPAPVLKEGAEVRGVDPPQLEELINEAVSLLEGIKGFIDELSPEDRENLHQLFLALSEFSADDVQEIRRLISNAADATEDLKAIASDVRPEIKPTLNDVQYLIYRLNRTVTDLRKYMPEDPDQAKDRVEELIGAADDLAAMADRLERLTASIEKDYGDMDRQEIERIIREFFQQEGITINIGTIVKEPPGKYPEPPEKED